MGRKTLRKGREHASAVRLPAPSWNRLGGATASYLVGGATAPSRGDSARVADSDVGE